MINARNTRLLLGTAGRAPAEKPCPGADAVELFIGAPTERRTIVTCSHCSRTFNVRVIGTGKAPRVAYVPHHRSTEPKD